MNAKTSSLQATHPAIALSLLLILSLVPLSLGCGGSAPADSANQNPEGDDAYAVVPEDYSVKPNETVPGNPTANPTTEAPQNPNAPANTPGDNDPKNPATNPLDAEPPVTEQLPIPNRPAIAWTEPEIPAEYQLLHHWDFNEADGDEVIDQVAGFNGKLIDPNAGRIQGVKDGAVHIRSGIDLPEMKLPEEFTIATWMRWEDFNQPEGYLFANRHAVGTREETTGVAISFKASESHLTAVTGDGEVSLHLEIPQRLKFLKRDPIPRVLEPGKWMQVTAAFSSTPLGQGRPYRKWQVDVYVNGLRYARFDYSLGTEQEFPLGGRWCIGAGLDGGAPCNMSLDDFRIYAGALKPEHIRALAATQSPPARLIHHWTFDQGTVDTSAATDVVSGYRARFDGVSTFVANNGMAATLGNGKIKMPATDFGDAFSVAMWVNQHNQEEPIPLFTILDADGEKTPVKLELRCYTGTTERPGTLTLTFQKTESGNAIISGDLPEPLENKWVHIVFTVDQIRRQSFLYINGQEFRGQSLHGSNSPFEGLPPRSVWHVGGPRRAQDTTADIDDVQVYWGVLSEGQIAQLAQRLDPNIPQAKLPPIYLPKVDEQEDPSEAKLLHRWTFDEGAGDTIRDDVSQVEGKLAVLNPEKAWVEGVRGKALNLGEAVAQIPNLDFGHPGSISLWYKETALVPDYQTLFRQGINSKHTSIVIGDEDAASSRVWIDGRAYYDLKTTPIVSKDLTLQKWHHLVLVTGLPGSYEALYLDGKFIDKQLNKEEIPFAGPIRLGATFRDANLGKLHIDELELYSGTLTEAQISQLYTQGSAGVPTEVHPVATTDGDAVDLDEMADPAQSLWTRPYAGEEVITSKESAHVLLIQGEAPGPGEYSLYDLRSGYLLRQWTATRCAAAGISPNGKWLLTIYNKDGAAGKKFDLRELPSGDLLQTGNFDGNTDVRVLGFDDSENDKDFVVFADSRLYYVKLTGETDRVMADRFRDVEFSADTDNPVLLVKNTREYSALPRKPMGYDLKYPSEVLAVRSNTASYWRRDKRTIIVDRKKTDNGVEDLISVYAKPKSTTELYFETALGDLELENIQFAQDGCTMSATDKNGTSYHYSLVTQVLQPLPGRPLGFTPQGVLMIGVTGEPLQFISPEDGRKLFTPLPHGWADKVSSVGGFPVEEDTLWTHLFFDDEISTSMDGFHGLSWGADRLNPDNDARVLWNLETGEKLAEWSDSHRSEYLALSPKAYWCLSAGKSPDNTAEIRLYRLPAEEPSLLPELYHTEALPPETVFYSVSYLADGSFGYVFTDQGIYSASNTGKFKKETDRCPKFAHMGEFNGKVVGLEKTLVDYESVEAIVQNKNPTTTELTLDHEITSLHASWEVSTIYTVVPHKDFVDRKSAYNRPTVYYWSLGKDGKRTNGSRQGIHDLLDHKMLVGVRSNTSSIPMPRGMVGEVVNMGMTRHRDLIAAKFGGQVKTFPHESRDLDWNSKLPEVRQPPKFKGPDNAAASDDAPPDNAPEVAAEDEPVFRTWKSRDEKFSVEATLIGKEDINIILKTRDGREIKIPFFELSPADNTYINSVLKK